MKTLLSRLFLPIILLAVTFGCATAPPAQDLSAADNSAVIKDIRLDGDSLVIVCSKGFTYTMYSANDPYKVTIEIPDVELGKFKDKIVFENATVAEVNPRQTDSPHTAARLDLTLQTPSSAVPFYRDNTLTLAFKQEEPVVVKEEKALPVDGGKPSAEAEVKEDDPAPEKADIGKNEGEKAPEAASTPKAPETRASLPKATEITGIRLKRTDGMVKVVITGNGAMAPDVFPLDNRIVIDIPSVSLKTLPPSSVIPPVKAIRAGKHKGRVRLVLDLRNRTAYDVSSSGDSVEIALRAKEGSAARPPAKKAPAIAEGAGEKDAEQGLATEEKPSAETKPVSEIKPEAAAKTSNSVSQNEQQAYGKYRGKKISLDFQDAEIGPIFRLLADVNGYNLVLDPSVRGKITIKLMNVPWDQALDIILNTFNLGKSIEGNILWIAPNAVFAKIRDEKAKEKAAAEKSEDLVQEMIRINYATAADLSTAISQGKLLSPRGSVTIDTRMNTLIIKDTKQSIDRIKELVAIMDVAKPQVMIEAKLVQVSTDYSKALGINWGGTFAAQTWPNTMSGSFSVNTPTTPAGPLESVPGGALNLTVGHANAVNVSLSLSALESIGKSKTLSNPRVLTMDNEAATIQQGRTFYIATTSQAGTQTQQQSATLSLNVTPKITPDGYVQMKVVATDNSLEPTLLGGAAGGSPVVDTKTLTTQALVKNGETLVLGGIYTTDVTESETSVPLLGKIPGLGWLFKTKTQTGPNMKELLIFITPTIISQPKPAAKDKI